MKVVQTQELNINELHFHSFTLNQVLILGREYLTFKDLYQHFFLFQILSPHDKEIQKEILNSLQPEDGAFQVILFLFYDKPLRT